MKPQLCIGLALSLLVVACGGEPAIPEGAPRGGESAIPEGAPRRIVLVTLDTQRTDNMSAYGYPIQTTPFFDSLAEQGVLFQRAYSHSATTKPSHASIFTSLYVMQHGVKSNALVLDEAFQTLAEMLSDAGYRTGAFVSVDAPLGGNLDQGFATWDQFQATIEPGLPRQYRPAAETVNAAVAWLATTDPSEKIFLWVHVYDPHRPMQPPQEHLDRVNAMIRQLGVEAYDAMLTDRGIPTKRNSLYNEVIKYDAEVLYADTEISRLFTRMQEAGLGDSAMWIITGDHGQGLGAHNWFGHSRQIYNAQLHVPLLFWFSGRTEGAVVADRIVEHVDLLPTIAEIVGTRPAQILPIQGRSLVPCLQGNRARDPKWFALSERSRYADGHPRHQLLNNYEPGRRYALQNLRFKYLLFTEGEDEFYDLEADPYEMNNLIESPEVAGDRDQMLGVLLEMLRRLPSGRQVEGVSPEDIGRLRALGYIQ